MGERPDISVIIPTFNRARMLSSTLESVFRQSAGGVHYEVVVVDNNSDDDTRHVVEGFAARGENVRYLFEKQQGVSNARNCGINNTSADILAFIDDDVIAENDWISKIKRSLDRHSDILLVGGKVLPLWKTRPPTWLTSEHWSPLALVDYGEETFFVDWNRQICLVTANLAVRRCAFEKYGLFLGDLKRCEDHEFESRIYRGGDKGLYDPEMVVMADVQNERLTKNYHRRWWSGRGRALAQIRAFETAPLGATPEGWTPSSFRIFGIGLDVYREFIRNVLGWILAIPRGETGKAFYFEAHVRDVLNYILETYRLSATWSGRPSHLSKDIVADAEAFSSSQESKGTARDT